MKCILTIKFLIICNVIFSQDSLISRTCYTKNSIRLAFNNGSVFVPFFDKHLERKRLKNGHFVCHVDNNRLKLSLDTLILDLTRNLNSNDSLQNRIKRHLNYGRWIPTHIEPRQYIAYKIKVKRKYINKVSIIKILVELDNQIINYYLRTEDFKSICSRSNYGKML